MKKHTNNYQIVLPKTKIKTKTKNYLDLIKSTRLNTPIYKKYRQQSNMLSKTMRNIIIKIQTMKNSTGQITQSLQQSKILKIFSPNSYKLFNNYNIYEDLKFER